MRDDILDSMEFVLAVNSLPHNRKENQVICPVCTHKKGYANTETNVFFCQHCKTALKPIQFHAAETGMTWLEAVRDLKEKGGVTESYTPTIRRVFGEEKIFESPIAPPKVRDATYKAFLQKLPLKERHKKDLLERGLSEASIVMWGFKSLPSWKEVNYAKICKELRVEGYTLEGVPGFYMRNNKEGKKFWTFASATEGILVPYLNHEGQIVGLQIRKDDDKRRVFEDGEKEAKYSWMSSKGKAGGASSGSPVHWAFDFRFNKETKEVRPVHNGWVYLTEGAMKADICHCLLPKKPPFLAVAGVDATKNLEEALKVCKDIGIKQIALAYDADYLKNPNVKDAMEKTVKLITSMGFEVKNFTKRAVKEGMWEHPEIYKGLDDLLAFKVKGIKTLI